MAGSDSDSDPTFQPASSSPVHSAERSSTQRPRDRTISVGHDSEGEFSSESSADRNPLPASYDDRNSESFSPDSTTAYSNGDRQSSSPPLLPIPATLKSNHEVGDHKIPQIPVQLLDNPFAREPTYFTRPNRYFGPASTWRSWTQNDREISDAIEHERATNLSRHLFNAFALGRAASQAATAVAQSSSTRSGETGGELEKRGRKRSRTGTERTYSSHSNANDQATDGYNQSVTFEPPRLWTAWPLSTSDVPRARCLPSLSTCGFRMASTYDSNAELEDCLVALTTRYAKEKWQNRAWEEQPVTPLSPGAKLLGKLPDKSEVNLASDIYGDLNIQDEPVIDEESGSVGVGMWSSQVFAASSTSSSSGQDESEDESFRAPVFTADDAKTRTLLLPAARHTISRLDRLLSAAHIAQKSCASDRQRSLSRNKSSTKSGESDLAPNSPFKNGSRNFRPQSGDQSPEKHLPRSREDPEVLRSASRARSRGRRMPIQLRDWSAIIGLAAITQSFDAETITRASERCARLFEENMLFRTFHEAATSHDMIMPGRQGPNVVAQQDFSGPWFEDDFIIDDETDEEVPIREDVWDHVVGTRNPLIETQSGRREETRVYARSSEACSQCIRQKTKCDAPPLLQHPNKVRGRVRCDRCEKHHQECSGITVALKEQSRRPNVYWNNLKLCPFSLCERHSIPFKKQSHLRRHITVVHEHERMPTLNTGNDGRSHSLSSTHDSSAPSRDDAFYCPVVSCPRSSARDGKPFLTGSRMYTHVRKQHPEVDITAVKQLETMKRGERRGRWTDERRHRSRSQSKRAQSREGVEYQ